MLHEVEQFKVGRGGRGRSVSGGRLGEGSAWLVILCGLARASC